LQITYILQGEMQHKDSVGNTGTLSPGWVQWMTAGSGVVHSEMPSDAFLKSGGVMEGFQLWSNLPKGKKMVPPRYQDVPPTQIPTAAVPGAKSSESIVKVVAGAYNGTQAVIDTHTPLTYLDVRLAPGDATEAVLPADHVGFVYCYRGAGTVAGKALPEGSMAVLANDGGNAVSLAAKADGEFRALFIGGQPLSDPIARYGPFVMNTQTELRQAFEDYQSGRFGEIEGSEARYGATEAARQSQKQSGKWEKEL
jgi:redox-sensitive bicupin YhaK (pirin superfamily)